MPDEKTKSAPDTARAKPKRKRKDRTSRNPRRLPPYNVVLLNDDDHTYVYVIAMLGSLFGYSRQKAFTLAKEVDTAGRVILLTTTKEHAELKRDQIHAYGVDKQIASCRGSMSAIIEPAR